MRDLYACYRTKAARRGIRWGLSWRLFAHITQQPCAYCGAPPSNCRKKKRESLVYSGIDRIDSALGYLPANCVPSCKICNRSKMDLPIGDFVCWLRRIIKNSDKIMQLARGA